jgi:hypothetical protein
MFIFMVAPLIPEFLVHLLYNYLPSRGLQRYRDTKVLFQAFAKSLVASKMEELDQGRSGRDVMSLLGLRFCAFPRACWLSDTCLPWYLVRANASSNAQTKLSGYELLSQMLCVVFRYSTMEMKIKVSFFLFQHHHDCWS